VALLAWRFCWAAHRIGDVAGNVDNGAGALTASRYAGDGRAARSPTAQMIGDLNRFCGEPITARKSGLQMPARRVSR
jgi:hypothetical protein